MERKVVRRRSMALVVGRLSAYLESYEVLTDVASKQSGAPERRRRHVHPYKSTRLRGGAL
jgi:hypothetical protein